MQGWIMGRGGSEEDLVPHEVEEKGERGREQDKIILGEVETPGAEMGQESRLRRVESKEETDIVPSMELTTKRTWLILDPKTMFSYCPVHPPLAMDAIQPLKPQ